MASGDLPQRYMAALNKLAKWRSLLAGWQLGTRPKGDPECDAVRDHRENSLIVRTELTALIGLLLKKGVITEAQIQAAVIDEAGMLCQDLEQKFPGVKATDYGLQINPAQVQGWMKNWKQ